MAAKNWIFGLLLAIAIHRWYPVSEHNILALVNTTTYDPSRIAQIKGLKAAFKIERNIDDKLGLNYHAEQKAKSQWKLAIILKNDVDGQHGKLASKKVAGEGWGDIHDDVLLEISKRLRSHDFIMNVALIPYTENIAWTKFQNFYLSTLKSLSTKFPSWFDVSFVKSAPEDLKGKIYQVLCDEKKIVAAGSKRQMVVKVVKQSEDVGSLKTHESLMSKYHSKIEAHMLSMGTADSDYWDNVGIVSYGSRAQFCEMTMSKQFQEAYPFKKHGYKDAHTYMTTQILECNEKIQTCTPVVD